MLFPLSQIISCHPLLLMIFLIKNFSWCISLSLTDHKLAFSSFVFLYIYCSTFFFYLRTSQSSSLSFLYISCLPLLSLLTIHFLNRAFLHASCLHSTFFISIKTNQHGRHYPSSCSKGLGLGNLTHASIFYLSVSFPVLTLFFFCSFHLICE